MHVEAAAAAAARVLAYMRAIYVCVPCAVRVEAAAAAARGACADMTHAMCVLRT